MRPVEIPVERGVAGIAASDAAGGDAWRRHAAALAADGEVRRATAAALLVVLQLCVWRFPFPGEVRLIGAIWRHPELLAEAAAVRLSGLAGALLGTLALALPLALALWLVVPRWRRHAPRALAAALAVDLACAALAPWIAALRGSVVSRTAQAALAGWLGGPAAAGALSLSLAALVVVLGFQLGPALREAARWGGGQLARGGEAAELSLARGVRRATAAAAQSRARLRARRKALEERRLHRAERAVTEQFLTPSGTWIEGAGQARPWIESAEGDGALERAAERVGSARAALRSVLRYHRVLIRRERGRWQKRWDRRQPISKG